MRAIGYVVTLDRLSVEGAGCEALGSAVERLNEELEAKLLEQAEGYLPDLQEQWNELDEESRKNAGFALQYDAAIRRCDGNVVSIYYGEYVSLGGAHPMIYAKCASFDAKTGERLKLEELPGLGDNGRASASFISALIWELTQVEDEYGLDDSGTISSVTYRNTAEYCFSGESDKWPAWFLEEDGVSVIFDPYVLAPFASGPVEVKVEYDLKTGKLGDKYYPEFDELMGKLEGTWRLFATEGEEYYHAAVVGDLDTVTFFSDGRAEYRRIFRMDGDPYEESRVDMALTLEDGGLWEGFPALRHLEYKNPDNPKERYLFALDGDRLILWYVEEYEAAFVQCYYREDDPDRFQPPCLAGKWIAMTREMPGMDIDYLASVEDMGLADDGFLGYSELVFTPSYTSVPDLRWYFISFIVGEWEEIEATPEIVPGTFRDDCPADWHFVFTEDYGGGIISTFRGEFLSIEDLLVVVRETTYPEDLGGETFTETFTYYREGTAVG